MSRAIFFVALETEPRPSRLSFNSAGVNRLIGKGGGIVAWWLPFGCSLTSGIEIFLIAILRPKYRRANPMADVSVEGFPAMTSDFITSFSPLMKQLTF